MQVSAEDQVKCLQLDNKMLQHYNKILRAENESLKGLMGSEMRRHAQVMQKLLQPTAPRLPDWETSSEQQH